MVKVLNQLLSRPVQGDSGPAPPNVHLVFANKTERDIMWHKELDGLARKQEK